MKKILILLWLSGFVQAAPISYVQVDPPTTQPGGFKLSSGTVTGTLNTNCVKFGDGSIQCVAGGGGSTNGTIVASPQYRVPFYSLSGTTTTVQGDGGLTTNGTGILTAASYISTGTTGSVTINAPIPSLNLNSTSLVAPYGVYRFAVPGQIAFIQGRNAANTGWDSIMGFTRKQESGPIVTILSTGTLRFQAANNIQGVGFKSSATVASDVLWTLPASDASGAWQSDGAGNLTIGPISAIASGNTNYIQVRDTLQSGATFYVSSGTIAGAASVGTLKVGAGAAATGRSDAIVVDSGDIAIGQNTFIPDRRIRWYGFANTDIFSMAANSFVPNGLSFFNASSVEVSKIFTDDALAGSNSRQGVIIRSTGSLRLYDADNSNYVSLRASSTVSSDIEWTLPAADGTSGQAIVTNGNKVLSFTTIAGGSGGSSSLGVNYNGVSITSPTAQLNFIGGGVSVGASGSTATITINAGTTPGATYYVQVRDTLQAGSTFYVSSGTVQNQFLSIGKTGVGALSGIAKFGVQATDPNEIAMLVSGMSGQNSDIFRVDRVGVDSRFRVLANGNVLLYSFSDIVGGFGAASRGFSVSNLNQYGFSSTGGESGGFDAGLSRIAAGVVGVGWGTANTSTGTIVARQMIVNRSTSTASLLHVSSGAVSIDGSGSSLNISGGPINLTANPGTSGQILTSGGAGVAPTWTSASGASPLSGFYLKQSTTTWLVTVTSSGTLVTTVVSSVPTGALYRTSIVMQDSAFSFWTLTVNSSGTLVTTSAGSATSVIQDLIVNDSTGLSWIVTVNTSGALVTS